MGDLDREPANDLEIVVGTADGTVVAVHADGEILWSFQTADAINAVAEVPTDTTIRSAPCLADLDGDGWLEVIVGVGTVGSEGENGGVVALDHEGHLLPGWPVLTFSGRASGATDGVASSPAAGDLDNDGLLEIVFGAFDQRVYAYQMDGTLLPEWPRFVHDTVWSSPAVADLDGDGFSEIIIGSDGHYSSYWGFEDGGYLHVFDYQGKERAGFPKHVPQTIASSPALADLDGDGFLDIIVGTGTYYSGTGGYRVSAWDRNGNPLPGWPVSTGGNVPGSPAVGDIDGDGDLEVVVGAHDMKIWAWNHDGTVKWSRTPKDYTGTSRTLGSPNLADYDNDGRLEVFFNFGWEVGILDHNGSQITWNGNEPNEPARFTYYTDYSLFGTPSIADLDNDGYLELIAGGGYNGGANGRIYVWQFDQPQTHQVADWPMFRKDAIHSASQGLIPQYDAAVVETDVPDLVPQSHLFTWQVTVRNTGSLPWGGDSWGLSGYNPAFSTETFLPLSPGETVVPGEARTFSFTVVTPPSPGFCSLTWRMDGPGTNAFGAKYSREIKVGQEPALYVFAKEENPLSGQSLYPGGIAPALGPVTNPFNFSYGRAMAMRPDGRGYYLLTKYGALHWGGDAPDFGGWVILPSQDLVIAPDGNGIYRLGNNGEIDKTVGLPTIDPRPFVPNARSLAITRNGRGAYILDAYGNIYRAGTAPALTPPAALPLSDPIAKRIKLTADQTGYHVLDAYGRLHPGGSAPAIAPNYAPHVGEDWARDFDLTLDGLGYYMVDRYGVIHTGGTAADLTINLPPTWPDDTAIDIEVLGSLQLTDPYLGPHISPVLFLADLVGNGNRFSSFSLDNFGWGGTLNWTASTNPTVGWLDIQPPVGQTPAQVQLEITSLPPEGIGTYDTLLVVEAYLDGALVDTIETPVTLIVVDKLSISHLPLVAR